MKHPQEANGLDAFSRRALLASGATLTALAATGCAAGTGRASGSAAAAPRPPFDTYRDYIGALDAHGLVVRIPRIDQDAYEATGLFFRATDRYGMFGAPAFRFDEVRVNGEWLRGPLFTNHQGHWYAEAILWGLEVIPGDGPATYHRVKQHMKAILAQHGGRYPEIPPVEIPRERALCKEVVLTNEQIDLTRFAFIQTNPADAGRYVNTGSIFTQDPEMGVNFGTYRCQLKGPRLLGVNPEPNQTGNRMLMAARARGEKFARIAIVLGQDPVVWLTSSTRVAPRRGSAPVDELAVAGGLRGKPVEVVKCETSELRVPAHAEMVIEGEVPLQEPGLPEGPFGEMFGYMGPYKPENFWMKVTCVTHRRDPWLMNSFTGMQRGFVTAPIEALYDELLRRLHPSILEFHYPQDTVGVVFVRIAKTAAGQGLEAGRKVAERIPIGKVVVVVDQDLDVVKKDDMWLALGTRWQPYPASEIIRDIPGIITDPSQPVQGRTSKIVIDATRQWPEEGGRERFPELNRALLEQRAPGTIAAAERRFGELLRDWSPDRSG